MDISPFIEKQQLSLQVNDVLEFRSFAKKVLKDLDIGLEALSGDLQYNVNLPNGEELTINGILLDNSSGKYFQPRGINNYMVATLPGGDIAGIAYVGVKKLDTYFATRNFMISNKNQGIGTAMNAATIDWLQRVSTQLGKPIFQVIYNQNLELLEQLEQQVKDNPHDQFLRAKYQVKLTEQLRYESIFGKSDKNYTSMREILPQTGVDPHLKTASEIQLVRDSSNPLKYIPGTITIESPQRLAELHQTRMLTTLHKLEMYVG